MPSENMFFRNLYINLVMAMGLAIKCPIKNITQKYGNTLCDVRC